MYTLGTVLFSKAYFRIDLSEQMILFEVFAQRERKKTYVKFLVVTHFILRSFAAFRMTVLRVSF